MQAAAWVIWAILGGGALLTTLSLLHSLGRFRQWKSVQTEHEGEIVLADRALEPGQRARVVCSVLPRPLTAQLTGISRRTLRLTLELPLTASIPMVWPPIGSTVTVMIAGACELLQFSACVRDVRPEEGELQLSRPTWLACIQRRQHARADFCLPATFERGAPSERVRPVHGTVLNLSGGGFRAELGEGIGVQAADKLIEAFTPTSTLRVRLPLPALPDALLARVLTCERAVTRGGLTVRLTCEFLPISTWEQDILVQHVFRQYREQWGGG